MSEVFASARDLIDSANGHLEDLVSLIDQMLEGDWGSLDREIDPTTGDKLYKVRFGRPVPIRAATRVFNVATELRAALDHAVYAATCAITNKPDPSRTKFPFGDDAAQFEQELFSAADHVPAAIRTVLYSLKPYRDGNLLLWSLNKLRNVKDHRKLIIPVPHANVADLKIFTPDRNIDFAFYQSVGPSNEYVFARFPGHMKMEGQVELILHVAFSEVEAVKGLEPIQFLTAAMAEVSAAVDQIEQATIQALEGRS